MEKERTAVEQQLLSFSLEIVGMENEESKKFLPQNRLLLYMLLENTLLENAAALWYVIM